MTTSEKQTVLIVDDEPLNIKILSRALCDDYEVQTAGNGQEALVIACGSTPPDLILLDVLMPEMDGHELCRKLKNADKTRDIPVIFLTGQDSVEDEAKGLELGAVDYIAKPFSLPIIMARVGNHMKLKKKTDLLEKLASIDGLTEIRNRRFFDLTLDSEWQRLKNLSRPLSLILMDIDFFKPFNDNYGHSAGDDCLRRVAASLQEGMDSNPGIVARYGGEEFVVVLPDVPVDDAVTIGNTLREGIQQLAVPHEHSEANSVVTMSMGLATVIPNDDSDPQTLLKQADEQLYKAKESGRNQLQHILL